MRLRVQAGGFVAEGRVNGSLNLSRAVGDHEYKQVCSPLLHAERPAPTFGPPSPRAIFPGKGLAWHPTQACCLSSHARALLGTRLGPHACVTQQSLAPSARLPVLALLAAAALAAWPVSPGVLRADARVMRAATLARRARTLAPRSK